MIRGMMRSMLLLPAIVAIQAAHGAETDTGADLRDPFWPVSFNAPAPLPVPDEKAEPGASTAPAIPWPALPISSVARAADGTYFAYVDGFGVVKAGEVASIQKDNLWFHYQITSIAADGISFIKLGATRDKKYIPPTSKSSRSATEKKP